MARPRVSLIPGARDEITIVIRPGEGAAGPAGAHRFTVVVQSREHGFDVRSIGELTVQPVEKIEAVMRPLKGRGDFTVEVRNRGNVAAPLAIDGSDDEGKLEFSIRTRSRSSRARRAWSPWAWLLAGKKKFGRESSTPFRIGVRTGRPGCANPTRWQQHLPAAPGALEGPGSRHSAALWHHCVGLWSRQLLQPQHWPLRGHPGPVEGQCSPAGCDGNDPAGRKLGPP